MVYTRAMISSPNLKYFPVFLVLHLGRDVQIAGDLGRLLEEESSLQVLVVLGTTLKDLLGVEFVQTSLRVFSLGSNLHSVRTGQQPVLPRVFVGVYVHGHAVQKHAQPHQLIFVEVKVLTKFLLPMVRL
jgi:hypothetical protein